MQYRNIFSLIYISLTGTQNLVLYTLYSLPVACVKTVSMYLQNCCIYLLIQYLARRGKEGLQDFKLNMFMKETCELNGIIDTSQLTGHRSQFSISSASLTWFLICLANCYFRDI